MRSTNQTQTQTQTQIQIQAQTQTQTQTQTPLRHDGDNNKGMRPAAGAAGRATMENNVRHGRAARAGRHRQVPHPCPWAPPLCVPRPRLRPHKNAVP